MESFPYIGFGNPSKVTDFRILLDAGEMRLASRLRYVDFILIIPVAGTAMAAVIYER